MKRRRSETQRGVGGCGEKRCRRLSRPPLPPPLSLLHASATTLEAALKLLGVPSESQASSDVYVVFDLKAPDLLTWKEQQREGRGSVNGSGCSGNVKLLVEKVIEEKFKCGSTSTSDVLLAGYRRSGVRPGSVERITSGSVPSDLVTTSAWQKLLLRVGTDVMKYLLLHSSIFVTQGNEWGKRFYMQATGSPIGHDAYRKMKGGTKKRRICLPRVDLFKIQASRKDATGTAGFSSTHELMTLSAKELLQRIFLADLEDGQKSSSKGMSKATARKILSASTSTSAQQQQEKKKKKVGTPKKLRHLKPLMAEMVGKAKSNKSKVAKLLETICPSPPAVADEGLMEDYSSDPRDVANFIYAVIKWLVPTILLGSKHNQNCLRRAIYRFLTRKRFEEMTLDEAVFKMRLKEFAWFDSAATASSDPQQGKLKTALHHRKHTLMLRRWIMWVFTGLVVPLLGASFYVTNVEGRGHKLFFFRHSFWLRTCKTYMDRLSSLEGGGPVLEEVAPSHMKETIGQKNLGIAWLRLVPKGKGMRVISNHSKATNIQTMLPAHLKKGIGKFVRQPINSSLKDAFNILQHEIRSMPGVLGASCFSFQDIYQRLCNVLHEHKTRDSCQKLYVVSCDVHKAYDTIDSEHLLSMVDSLLERKDFTLNRFTKTFVSSSKIVLSKSMQTCGAFPPNGTFEEGFAHQNQILVNQTLNKKVNSTSVQQVLREHLLSNLVFAYRKFYKQTVGIPQGSILSTLLCSFYLANIEVNRIFPTLNIEMENKDAFQFHLRNSKGDGGVQQQQPQSSCSTSNISPNFFPASMSTTYSNKSSAKHASTLLRFVDDYLFISTSKEDAKLFLDLMHKGFPEYNCHMNRSKTSCNFVLDDESDGGQLHNEESMWVDGSGSKFLKWCGLLINVKTFEIQADYTRFLGSAMRESTYIPKQPWKTLQKKLCNYMSFRCNPLLFDPLVNSPHTVNLNIFQAFIYTGMRLCLLLEGGFEERSCSTKLVSQAIEFVTHFMILKVDKCGDMVKQQMLQPSYGSYRNRHVRKIPSQHVRWLATVGFLRVFKRKIAKYRLVVKRLEATLKRPQFQHLDHQLAEVIDPRNSPWFSMISF